MKQLLLYFILVLSLATACSKNLNPSIELGSGMDQEIILEPNGGSKIIRFTSTHSWYIDLPEEASWLELSGLEGKPGNGNIKIMAKANTSGETRKAEFNICSGTLSVPLSVIQQEPIFEVQETEKHISAAGGIILIPINTNLNFSVVSAHNWLIPSPSQGQRPEYIVVAAEPNLSHTTRSSEVVVSCKMGEVKVTITQETADLFLGTWAEKSFESRSLAMRFTATWCGYCPQMAIAFDSAKEQMKGALEIVNLHGNESNYEFSDTGQLIGRFDIGGFPTGVIDSRAIVENYSLFTTASIVLQVAQETKKSYPTTAGIAVDSYLSGTDLTVCVPLYFQKADDYRVTVLLLEDGIVGWQNGGGNLYTHNDVARKALTSMSGEAVKIDSANKVWTKVYTTKVSPDWNPENLKVLVYVEKPYGNQSKVKGVVNAIYGNFGDTYIDNCRVVKVGETANLELK